MFKFNIRFGIPIWGCAKPSQVHTIQTFQSISLAQMTFVQLWYISNLSLNKNLKIEPVFKPAKNYYKNHTPNQLTIQTH